MPKKSKQSKFVDISKHFVADRNPSEIQEVVTDFERDTGEIAFCEDQFNTGPDGLSEKAPDHAPSEKGPSDTGSEKKRDKDGREVHAEALPKKVRDELVRGKSNGGSSSSAADVRVVDESVYDRLMKRDIYTNVQRAGRRWIYTVYADSHTEAQRAKGVADLMHWCTHPLLPHQKQQLDADPQAFFTDRARTDPSQVLFCGMALSLHSIVSTEFSVERLFSLIHRTIGPFRSSLSNDGVTALAWYSAQAADEAKGYNYCFHVLQS
jgi:hypothetical protein